MEECVDGDYQKYVVEPGSYTRKHFFGKYPELLELVNHLTDDQIRKLLRGGHDARKVYAAYKAASEHKGQPTVILAKTVKGYGLGEAGEGKNISHQQKKMNEKELREFRERFKIPISDDVIAETPFYRPAPDSVETKYLLERRQALGGFLPARKVTPVVLDVPKPDSFADFFKGSNSEISTTTAFGNVLRILLRQKGISRNIVPIIPDEARTFGLDAFFREIGIYSSKGQLYEPVDSKSLLYYHEAKDGQILEEGITEAGSMASFIAAGTSYATHGVPMIPFYIYYSMFGPQRVGDLFWLAGDIRAKGFLLGATSGRTTLNGEGLQHQDGHSLLLASTIPTCLPYDPAFGYELAVIVADGLRRMYVEGEDIFYYLSLYNENYSMPPMPAGVEDGILKGLYKFKAGPENLKMVGLTCRSAGRAAARPYRQSPHLRQRADHSIRVEGAGNPRRTLRCLRRCLERDQLQTAAHRRHPLPALEHAAPDRAAEEILRRDIAGERARGVCRRLGQHPHGARPDCAVGSGRIVHAGHGRLWPQRHPRAAAPLL